MKLSTTAATGALLITCATGSNALEILSSIFGDGSLLGGLGSTRAVPGSLCPCFQLDDLIDGFHDIPLEFCRNGLAAEDFSSPDNRACTGNLCRGGGRHCSYTDSDGEETFIDNISQQEEAHCFDNLDVFCALYAVVMTDSPTQGPTGSPTQAPAGNPTTSSTQSPTGSPTETPSISPTTTNSVNPTQAPSSKPPIAPTIETLRTATPTTGPIKAPTASEPVATDAPTAFLPFSSPTVRATTSAPISSN